MLGHGAGWLSIALVVPVAAEIVFRAVLIELLWRRLSTSGAVVLSAAIFGLAHLDLRVGIGAFVLGLIFGAAYVKTKSIAPGVMGHVATNIMGLYLLKDGGVTEVMRAMAGAEVAAADAAAAH